MILAALFLSTVLAFDGPGETNREVGLETQIGGELGASCDSNSDCDAGLSCQDIGPAMACDFAAAESAVGNKYYVASTEGCLQTPYNTYTDKVYTKQSCYDKCVADNCNFFSMTSRHPGKCWTSTSWGYDHYCTWKEYVYVNNRHSEIESAVGIFDCKTDADCKAGRARRRDGSWGYKQGGMQCFNEEYCGSMSESAVGNKYYVASTEGCLQTPYNTYTDKVYTKQSCYDKCVADNCNFFSMTSRHPGKCWTSTSWGYNHYCTWKEYVYVNDRHSAESLAFTETSPSTSWTATVTNVLAAFGLAVTAYGAFKHYVGK